jgi:hypothetical protein
MCPRNKNSTFAKELSIKCFNLTKEIQIGIFFEKHNWKMNFWSKAIYYISYLNLNVKKKPFRYLHHVKK